MVSIHVSRGARAERSRIDANFFEPQMFKRRSRFPEFAVPIGEKHKAFQMVRRKRPCGMVQAAARRVLL